MKEILNLSTKVERPFIKINDVDYELMLPTDLDLKDVIWIERASVRLEKLQKQLQESDIYNDSVAQEFERTLRKMTSIILGPTPLEVQNKLSDTQRMQVSQAYLRLLNEEKPKRPFVEAEEEATGQTSSQTSSASTEARSTAG